MMKDLIITSQVVNTQYHFRHATRMEWIVIGLIVVGVVLRLVWDIMVCGVFELYDDDYR